MSRLTKIILFVHLIFFTGIGLSLTTAPTASAANAGDWRAGNIIDDSIFYDNTSMTTQNIQNFLNSKVSNCDTNGTKTSEHGGGTRAQYGTSRGYPPPYTCLKDYSQNGLSAAQIIKSASDTYNVSPKILLVLLQKEQTLITDDWPWSNQYRSATGYGCPDTAACDSQYYGYYNQVMNAARQFRLYANNPANYRYKPYQSNYIQYNPNAGCGGTNVYIENKATAGLYNYTPYQPNASALNNLYGSGDGCGAYGNRNFWRLFTDWFGSSTTILSGITMTNISQPPATTTRGQSITYSFSLSNARPTAVTLDAVGVVGRAGSLTGVNRDLGWAGPVTLQPGTTQNFSFTSIVQDSGKLYVWPAANYMGTYVQYNNWGSTVVSLAPNFSVSGLSFSNTTPAKGEDLGASFTITNNLPVRIDVSAVGVVGRLGTFTGANRDIGWQGPTHFEAGETKSFTGLSRTITDVGTHYYWIGILYQGDFIQFNNWGSTVVSRAPNFSLTQPLTTNPTVSHAGQNATFSAVLKNNEPGAIKYDAIGIPVKFYDKYNYDAVWVGPGVIEPGAEITLSGLRNIDKPGPYTYWVANYFGGTYSAIGPVKKINVSPVAPNFSVSGLSFSNTTPAKGEDLGASFTITNNLPVRIDVSAVGVVGRLGTFTGANRDIGWQGPTHFEAGETKSFTGLSRTITDVGTHYYWIGILYQGDFIQFNNWGSTVVSRAP